MDRELLNLFNNDDAIKIIISMNLDGTPHPTVKSSLRYNGKYLLYYEIIESSRTNRNITSAIWFNNNVNLLLILRDGRSFHVIAKPVRSCISGKEFIEHYACAAREFPATNLAAVWVFEPIEIIDQSLSTRLQEERAERSYLTHLDCLAKTTEKDVSHAGQ